MVDPALDGPREIVEFGTDRAERPADNGVATIASSRRQPSSLRRRASSSSLPIVARRIYEKVEASNSQIKWLQQAILSN
jgi:hypothetical protein